MLKLIKFDFSLILKSHIWRIFYILFLILFAIIVPITTYNAIVTSTNEVNLGETLFFTCNIFTFLTFAAPMSKNNISKIGGNYTKIILSLPMSKRTVLLGKYASLMICSLLVTLYILILSLITFTVMGEMLSLVFLQALLIPVISSILFFGALYLMAFFIVKNHATVSAFIYFISMMSFMILMAKETVFLIINDWYLLLFSITSLVVSYMLSAILLRFKSF